MSVIYDANRTSPVDVYGPPGTAASVDGLKEFVKVNSEIRISDCTKVISSDNHIYEPPDLWTSRVEVRFRDRAPRVVRLKDEGDWWFCDGHKIMGAFAGAQAGRRFEAPERLSRKDLFENVRELQIIFILRHVSDVRGADNVLHTEQGMIRIG